MSAAAGATVSVQGWPKDGSAAQRDTPHRTRPSDQASSLQIVSRASQQARRMMTGMRNMVLKGFSYAMIGAFAGGIAMTIVGSAGVLMGL
jgi:ABC-type microcin C transport system permease subunit YejE